MLKKTFLGVLFAVFVSGLLIAGINFNVTKAVDYGGSGTSVGGIIWENTTWTLEGSPYTITDTVQIPENVTLTIDPGVTIGISSSYFSGEYLFLFAGTIHAHGTSDRKITFDGGGKNFFGSVNYHEPGAFLSLQNCIIKNGSYLWLPAAGDWGGYFELRYSEIIGTQSYMWNPTMNIFIEHNIFINSAGFSGNPGPSVYIRYNLFKGNSGPVVESYSGQTIVKYNSFIEMTGIVLRLPPGYSPVVIIATENYWGTTDTKVIDSMIYDKNDDITCAGFIEYLPILNDPYPNTPTLPIIVDFTYAPSALYAHGTVTFDGSASFGLYSTIANFTWDFGDGNITTVDKSVVTHTYTTPGNYNITLTVTDEFGFKNSTMRSLTVLQDDVPPMIGIPSRMPEGDVEPGQEVRILVNVTDSLSGIKDVTLSYNLNDSDVWIDSPMTFNSTTGLYETAIQVQQAHTLVRYEITAYDNAGNHMVEDNSGEYYVYTVIPEFPSTKILLLFMIAALTVAVYKRKHSTDYRNSNNRRFIRSHICNWNCIAN
jgi:PKD repeat protein